MGEKMTHGTLIKEITYNQCNKTHRNVLTSTGKVYCTNCNTFIQVIK